MIKYVRTLQPRLAVLVTAFATLCLAEVFPFLYPWVLGKVLDGPAIRGDMPELRKWILFYCLFVAVHASTLFTRFLLGQRLSIETAHRLRLRVFAHLQKLPISFFQRNPIGSLITRLTSDVENFGSMFSEGFLELFSNVALLLFSVVFMLRQDLRLGLATLTFFPAMVIVSAYFRKRFRALQAKLRSELAGLNGFLQESFNGVGIIQAFRKQRWLTGLFDARNEAYRHTARNYAGRYAGFFPIVQSLSDFSLLACYAAGIWFIGKGELSVGTMAAFAWYASIYSRPLRDLSDRINTLQTAFACGDRVIDFLATPCEQAIEGRLRLTVRDDVPAIRLDGVHFAYQPEKPVLKGISLEIARGTTAALVGPTGCGKSSTLNLLVRFAKAQQGSVSLFGIPVADIATDSLRQHVAVLAQDPFLFPGSIRDNVCLGRPFDEVRFADTCRRAQLTSWLERLPAQDATVVGTGGQELSSGQRQLVAYARALYQDPAILILDEPSSSIDALTEHLLQQALKELLQGRTALLVTHRIASIAACQRVFLMDDGRIEAQGSHEHLLASHPRYAQLFSS